MSENVKTVVEWLMVKLEETESPLYLLHRLRRMALSKPPVYSEVIAAYDSLSAIEEFEVLRILSDRGKERVSDESN